MDTDNCEEEEIDKAKAFLKATPNLENRLKLLGDNPEDDGVFLGVTRLILSKTNPRLLGHPYYDHLRNYGELSEADKQKCSQIDPYFLDHVLKAFGEHGLEKFKEKMNESAKAYFERYDRLQNERLAQHKLKLKDIYNDFKTEASKCAEVEAYRGALAMSCSAVETILLDQLIKTDSYRKHKTECTKENCIKKYLFECSLSDLIKIAKCTKHTSALIADVFEYISEIRNFIHPGRSFKDVMGYVPDYKTDYLFVDGVRSSLENHFKVLTTE